MALAACVQTVLCGLSRATRNAISSLLNVYLLQLNAYKAELQARLIRLNVAATPIELLNTFAQQAVAQVKAGANIIPLDIIGECLDVGSLNATIQANLDVLLFDANLITDDLQRLLSFRDELAATINDIEVAIAKYEEVLDLLVQACEDA